MGRRDIQWSHRSSFSPLPLALISLLPLASFSLFFWPNGSSHSRHEAGPTQRTYLFIIINYYTVLYLFFLIAFLFSSLLLLHSFYWLFHFFFSPHFFNLCYFISDVSFFMFSFVFLFPCFICLFFLIFFFPFLFLFPSFFLNFFILLYWLLKAYWKAVFECNGQ